MTSISSGRGTQWYVDSNLFVGTYSILITGVGPEGVTASISFDVIV